MAKEPSQLVEVMLPHTAHAAFRRTVTGGNGQSRVIVFEPGIPVSLKPWEVNAIPDIGTTLKPVYRDARGKPRAVKESADVAQTAGG